MRFNYTATVTAAAGATVSNQVTRTSGHPGTCLDNGTATCTTTTVISHPSPPVPGACPALPVWVSLPTRTAVATFQIPAAPAQLVQYDPATGAELARVNVNADYGDIAISRDSSTMYGVRFSGGAQILETIDQTTGLATAIPLSAALPAGTNALTVQADGTLLAGGDADIVVIDPATGAVTDFGMDLPAGYLSGGDLLTLANGDIIALVQTGGVSHLLRISPDGTSVMDIGSLPGSAFGAAQSGGYLYVATNLPGQSPATVATPELLRLEIATLPTSPSAGPCPTTWSSMATVAVNSGARQVPATWIARFPPWRM